jgi:hypothetical protein
MKPINKIYLLLVITALLLGLMYYLHSSALALQRYTVSVFIPYQNLRNAIFAKALLSWGDVFYGSVFLTIIFLLIRRFYLLLSKGFSLLRLLGTLLSVLIIAVFSYALFIISWAANYNKPHIFSQWQIIKPTDRNAYISLLRQFDSLLVGRLDSLSPKLSSLSYQQINYLAAKAYAQQINSPYVFHNVTVKKSLLTQFMQRLGIEGYYNPFTGESQVSKAIPSFSLPFVLSHEIAHQYGIAAEDDANLLAYMICMRSTSPDFQYAATLDTWIYVHYRLLHRDPKWDKYWLSRINKLTLAHIDTLEKQRKLYDNVYSQVSGDMYDAFLKMQHQKEGLKSYGNLTLWAWAWEQNAAALKAQKINLP